MNGPSDEARAALTKASENTTVETEERILATLYPIIRAELIAEVVEALRSMPLDHDLSNAPDKFIEREFGTDNHA